MFSDLFRIVSDYELAIPPKIAAVFRSLATVEGTTSGLEPGFDIVVETRRFAAVIWPNSSAPAHWGQRPWTS